MSDNRLVNYIKANLANGANEEQVRKALSEVGWADDLVNEAFLSLQKVKEEEFITLPTDEPLKESSSTKMLWTLLIIIVITLIAGVIVFVVMNSEEKTLNIKNQNEEVLAEEPSEGDEAGFLVNETGEIVWIDEATWELKLGEIYDNDDLLEGGEANAQSMFSMKGDDGSFYFIQKEFADEQIIMYLGYRGALAKCFVKKDYFGKIFNGMSEDWEASLLELKNNENCSGNFFDDVVFSALKDIKIEGLNKKEEIENPVENETVLEGELSEKEPLDIVE